jgi:hypothetical protein
MNMSYPLETNACEAPAPAPVAPPVEINKHLEIHQAIRDMSSVVDSLDNLLIRVRGPTPQTKEDDRADTPVSSAPTLSGVLNGSPSLIREKIERAHRLIDELNQELF